MNELLIIIDAVYQTLNGIFENIGIVPTVGILALLSLFIWLSIKSWLITKNKLSEPLELLLKKGLLNAVFIGLLSATPLYESAVISVTEVFAERVTDNSMEKRLRAEKKAFKASEQIRKANAN